MTSTKLQADLPFPTITVPQLGGGSHTLGAPAKGFDWKLVIVYRGKHCPLCTRYLQSLNRALPALRELGIDAVAVSADSAQQAQEHMADGQTDFAVGHDLSVEQMKTLGLYITPANPAMGSERPFSEPGLFVINAEGNLQVIDISNTPFTRPDIDMVVGGLKFLRNLKEPFAVNGSYV